MVEPPLPWSRQAAPNVDHLALGKPFGKDRRPPLPGLQDASRAGGGSASPPGNNGSPSGDSRQESNQSGPSSQGTGGGNVNGVQDGSSSLTNSQAERKLHTLEKSIDFLMREHKEILGALQKEIEDLKRDNNDLQFKLVMLQSGDVQDMILPEQPEPDKKSKQHIDSMKATKTSHLESEIRELKTALEEQRKRGAYLQQLFDQQTKEMAEQKDRNKKVDSEPVTETTSNNKDALGFPADSGVVMPEQIDLGGVMVHLSPLRVRLEEDQGTREPSLPECEAIIKLVLQSNMRLVEEMRSLQSGSGGVNSSPRAQDAAPRQPHPPPGARPSSTHLSLTQRASLLPSMMTGTRLQPPLPSKPAEGLRHAASAHPMTSSNTASPREKTSLNNSVSIPNQRRNPGIVSDSRQPQTIPAPPFVPREAVTLPALPQTLGTRAAERRRRTDVIHKRRLDVVKDQSHHPSK